MIFGLWLLLWIPHLCAPGKPVRLSKEVFDKIKHIPLPKPGEDGHYLPFSDVLGQPITEQYRPSLQQKALSSIAANLVTIHTTSLKVSPKVLDDYTYTCGSTLTELDLGKDFKGVEIKDHVCGDVIEKL